MGQKMVRFAQLGAARSRQDKSIEVGEVGSKRPSSGGNGGHVLSLYPLTWRSLCGCGWRAGPGRGMWYIHGIVPRPGLSRESMMSAGVLMYHDVCRLLSLLSAI